MNDKKYLQHTDAVNKLQELAIGINVCLFCSGPAQELGAGCRPMSTHAVDNDGNIWFMSARDSTKNQEIALDNQVKLFYSHPGKSSFLVVSGEAEIVFDRQKVAELWNPLDKTWFKGGEDDPDISLIKVKPENAHYWDVEGNQMVNFVKMVVSAATGSNLVKGEEGALAIN